MKLIVVYGSESDLISDYLVKNKNCKIIRIYNNNIPNSEENCIDLNINDNILFNIKKNIDHIENVDDIIFIGLAFKAENKLIYDLDDKLIDDLISTNISNYVNITKCLLPEMINLRKGSFIYLSSFRSTMSTRGAVVYSASKAFGEQYFSGLGKEYGRFNITSHILRMGYFDGRILDTLGSKKIKEIQKKISLNRLGNKFDITNTIEYCLENRYTNSGIIEINGGIDFR